jgi:methionine biosynthesis protein MetW
VDSEVRAARAAAYENPREEIQPLVPPGARRVLDLGCASGALGAALKRRQRCEVVGIEIDPAYAADARDRLDRVVQADLEELARRDDLREELGTFDCLIAGDVLEHLADPWSVLRRLAGLVAPGATVVVSLPNVRYWHTFWALGVRGTWPRDDFGVFDRTHLRWFTLRDAKAMLRDAGLTVETVAPQLRIRPLGSRFDPLVGWTGRTPLRELFAYQYVIGARRP